MYGVFYMENSNKKAMETTAQTISDTIIAVVDKLAGTKSDLKLSFENLTLDTGVFKATMNGAVVLDVTMAKEAQTS